MDQQESATPRETAPPESEEPQTSEQAPTDARLRVLEALEKGEIDIEDALSQLDRESGNA